MALYRKIDTRIWNDAKFRALSPNGKLAFFFLLTNPNMTALGAMRASIEGLSAELRVPAEAFHEVFGEGLQKDYCKAIGEGQSNQNRTLAIYDPDACCVFVPNFIKYQAAESPNVIKAWAKTLEFIPECPLKSQAIDAAWSYVKGMSKGFQKAFLEAFPEGLYEALPKDNPESVSSEQIAVNQPYTPKTKVDSSTKYEDCADDNFALTHPLPPNEQNDDGFTTFWHSYPKKRSKADAEKAWRKLKPNHQTIDELMAGLEREKATEQWQRDGGQYIPYPSKWLKGRRWEDEVDLPVENSDSAKEQLSLFKGAV